MDTYEPVNSKEKQAVEMAESFLQSGNVMISNSQWATQAEITKAFPLYIEGIPTVSYYECKVSIGDKDAGYILVNVNETDIPVPEYTTDGITVTGQFTIATRFTAEELEIYRYNQFEYIAGTKNRTQKNQINIVAEIGFSNTGSVMTGRVIDFNIINEKRNNFKNKVISNGCVPHYTQEELNQLIKEEKEYPDVTTRGKTKWYHKELKHTFSSGWHLPKWYQARFSYNGQLCPVGCTPLAVTMCYAYWRQFHGKNTLFGGANLNNYDDPEHSYAPVVFNAVREIGNDMGTRYTPNGGFTKEGRFQEKNIDNYGDDRGYSFICDVDYGGDWLKGQHAYSRIAKDQPLVVNFDTDGKRGSDHSAALEGVKYKKYKYAIVWHRREMWLLLNYGWRSGVRKWVCTYKRFNNSAETETTGFYHLWD